MKILIVRMYPYALNIKTYNCQEIGLAKALIRNGNQCDIVLYTDKNNYEDDLFFDNDKKIHIYYLHARNILKNAFFEKKLYEIAQKYDVVQTAEYDQIANAKLKKKVKGKMVIYHGPYASRYTKGYNLKCIISDVYFAFHPKYKNTVCLSKSKLATKLLEKKGFKNVTTVGVGLDTDRFNDNMEPNETVKNILKEKGNLKYLLYIGKIEERRNITFLIDVLKEVCEENSNVRLLLVGRGKKEYVDKCFDYAKEKNVMDKIIYYESIEQEYIPFLYKNCDVFLLPTQYEIFGMVLLEAMYFGIPVITTLNGGSSTLIENEKDGFICKLDVEEWRNLIIGLLDNGKKIESISKKAKEKIQKEYLWDDIVDEMTYIYKNINKLDWRKNEIKGK